MLPPSFTPLRKPITICNIVLSAAFALIGIIAINYLSARHPVRQKWLKADRFELSPLTRGILDSLNHPIQITILYNKKEASVLQSSISGLLAEYAFCSPQITLRHVDHLRDRKAAQELVRQYDLKPSSSGLVLFSSGDRFRIVNHKELRDYKVAANALLQGRREIQRVGFKGELLFTSAILHLAKGDPLSVAYLIGHGEHDPDNEALDGYSGFRQVLREKNFALKTHHLIKEGPLPEASSLLIIAGPRQPFAQEELAEIDRFLKRGGRLLALFNFNSIRTDTGLEALLKNWGIEVGMNLVDDIHKLVGTELAIAEYEDHPITTPLVDAKTGLLLFLPRSIDALAFSESELDKTFSQAIAFTSTNGMTKSDFRSGRLQFSHYRDRRGAIPVMSISKIKVKSKLTQTLSDQARLLVVGDSFFLTNARLDQYGNRDFAALASGWLLDQSEILQGIGPRPLYEFRLNIPDPAFKRLQWMLLIVFPGTLFLIGLLAWWRRRS